MVTSSPDDGELGPLWDGIRASLQDESLSAQQRIWLRLVRPLGFAGATLLLAAPDELAKDLIDLRLRPQIVTALSAVLDRPADIAVVVRPGPAAEDAPDLDDDNSSGAGMSPTLARSPDGRTNKPAGDSPRLNERYTFETFVIGDGNRFPHAAAVAVAEAPGRAYNPLFIYGDSGLGKTHLLHAIGHDALKMHPGLSVRYVNSEEFTNEFINAIRDDRQESFRRRHREVDVLLVDDIQFLENKERTQEEFFHTFNDLHQNKKQIVISSDRSPKDLSTLEERLRSRFQWGLITDVSPPDLETRIAILSKKAATDGLPVDRETLEYIATHIERNIRELEGALIRVAAYASLQNVPIDRRLAEAVLRDVIPDTSAHEASPERIMAETATFFGVSVDDLCGSSRSRSLVQARQIAMYLCREMTGLSLPSIGRHFGGRDHTTVMHAVRKIEALIKERPQIYHQIAELTTQIRAKGR